MALYMWLSIAAVVFVFLLVILIRAILLRLQIDNITKKAVFITGCDTGFGNLLAQTLDFKGVKVFAGCLTKAGAESLREVTSSRLHTIQVDITDKESVNHALEYVKDKIGEEGLWGVVNNAGVMPNFAPAEWTSVEEFEKTCKVNLFGTISVSLAFLPLLRKSQGRLVNVCSVTSSVAYPGIANYVISKAGVKMFTACVRRELMNTGLTAHTIEPGGFQTNITDEHRMARAYKTAYKQASPELQEYYGGHISSYVLNGFKLTQKFISNKPQTVADAMVHALLAKFPKQRYLIGTDAQYFFRSLMILPDWVGDLIFSWPSPYGAKAPEFDE